MQHLCLVALTFAMLSAAAPAAGQVVIKVNEDVNFKFGVLGQFQADWLEDADGEGTQQNLFLRRARVLFGGQVAKHLTFFVETDAPNLGKTISGVKNITPQVIVQDAFGTWTLHKAVAVDFGLMYVPFSRNSLQSGATLLPIDYGAYTFSTSAATQSTVGRDTGVQARGYAAGNRLEYRLGAFQGHRDAESHDSFRYAGRLQFQLLQPEAPGFFYTGTYLGTRRVATIGGAIDSQDDYHAYDIDAFLDHPLGNGAVTAQVAWNRIDGDTTFRQLPKQNVVFFEGGYLFRDLKLTPVFQYTRRNVLDTASTITDEQRWSLGLNYWWTGHNANVKAAYGLIDPRGRTNQRQFTVQLQFFYY
jgi:hypothetical protein